MVVAHRAFALAVRQQVDEGLDQALEVGMRSGGRSVEADELEQGLPGGVAVLAWFWYPVPQGA